MHKFYFTEPADSYSVKTFADSSAMGVIAVAIYREKERPQPLDEGNKSGLAPAAPSTGSAARSKQKMLAAESAGTGFGDAQYSPVVKVEFEPERAPAQKILVKYEWRDVLCRKAFCAAAGTGRTGCGMRMNTRPFRRDTRGISRTRWRQ